ncbi:MAG: DUF881 domain-containing protein [Actinomycetota bacterium]|nr:DUF881 domain-containing protein [Actinomycetota bacterium]
MSDRPGTGGREPPTQPPPARDLLSRLSDAAVDADYARVAARRQAAPDDHRRRPGWGVAVAVVLGLMISVAALQAQSREPTEARERSAVIEQIEERRVSISRSTSTLEGLQDEVMALQGDVSSAGASGDSLLVTVERSRILTGSGPVEGPGVRIVVDDADDATTEGGTVLDRDLQVLANGLWQAGAEAISINGQRLGSTSAIRVAGQAITVNYRPLTPPYTVTAIGDPHTLEARFSETAAGQSWFQLESNYSISFDMESTDDLTLPGVPAGRLRLRSAVQEGEVR